MTAPGLKPTAIQILEERTITLYAATDELLSWDRYEVALLAHLEQRLEISDDRKALEIVRRLQRGNRIEDSDHLELHAAVRGYAS